jgi:hypothetical protein
LNTLKELSDAIGADQKFSTTMLNSLNLKAPLNNLTFTGIWSAPHIYTKTETNTALASTANISDTFEKQV